MIGEIANDLSISWEAKVTFCIDSFEGEKKKEKKSPDLKSHGSSND